jgi:hypothetical protein
MVAGWNPLFYFFIFLFFQKHRFHILHSSTFPIQPDFSQDQPAAITLNTSSPRTLHSVHVLIYLFIYGSTPLLVETPKVL